jgi:hypothetical protein
MRHIPTRTAAVLPSGRPRRAPRFFRLLSIALMFADTRFRYLEGIRQVATIVSCSRCNARCAAGRGADVVGTYFASKGPDEKTSRRSRSLAHSLSVQEFAKLRDENVNLRHC